MIDEDNIPEKYESVDLDVVDLLPEFFESRSEDLVVLKDAVKNSDKDKLKSLGHKISGTCGMYGFSDMQVLAKKIENLGREGDFESVDSLIEELRAEVEDAKKVFCP